MKAILLAADGSVKVMPIHDLSDKIITRPKLWKQGGDLAPSKTYVKREMAYIYVEESK